MGEGDRHALESLELGGEKKEEKKKKKRKEKKSQYAVQAQNHRTWLRPVSSSKQTELTNRIVHQRQPKIGVFRDWERVFVAGFVVLCLCQTQKRHNKCQEGRQVRYVSVQVGHVLSKEEEPSAFLC